MQPILLASSSIYRRELFKRIGLPFKWISPAIDETPLANENADDLVKRLAHAKAEALVDSHRDCLIIGSDQVAVLDKNIIGKPHDYERAFQQLRAASGNRVIFKTGLTLLNAVTGRCQMAIEEFSVYFRELSDEQIHNYLTVESPYDCAGSFKCEGLGIVLFNKLNGDDPNTLIGLPLIRLIDMLKNEGIDPLLVNRR